MRPHRQQLIRLPRPWDSPGKNTGVGCHFLLQCMKVKSESEFAQSCPTLSEPMDCSLPGSSVRGIFQARILEWGAIAFSILQASRTQFKCLLNLCLPGCSTSKLQTNIPLYLNQSLFQTFWFIDMADHLLKLMAVTKTHFTEAQ